MDKFAEMRNQFPCLKTCAYFDSSSIGLISVNNYQAITQHLHDRMYYGMTGLEYTKNWNFTEHLRPKVAKMLNGDENGVFFGSNSSDIINVLTTGLDLKNKNVVTSGCAFPSLSYSWLNQQCSDFEVRMVQPHNGVISIDEIEQQMDENTIAVSVPMVEHSSGFRYDMYKLGQLCKERNAFFAVDATQCLGALVVDVEKMQIDFLTSSTYKWMTNVFGLGIGYVSSRLQKSLKQQYAGWASTQNRTDHTQIDLKFAKGARRYELGGLNWLGLKSLEQSLLHYFTLGPKAVETHVLELTKYLKESIQKVPGAEWMYDFPAVNLSQINFIRCPESWGLTTENLQAKGVRVNASCPTAIRVGIHYFNNQADVDKLINVLLQCSK